MKFSTKGEYGLRAMVNLAADYPAQKSVSAVSRDEKISEKYLERIFGVLKKAELLTSQKGKDGGYALSKNPREIRVGEIVEAMEGPIVIKCLESGCQKMDNCPSSFVWMKLGTQIKKTLYDIKLSDLIK